MIRAYRILPLPSLVIIVVWASKVWEINRMAHQGGANRLQNPLEASRTPMINRKKSLARLRRAAYGVELRGRAIAAACRVLGSAERPATASLRLK